LRFYRDEIRDSLLHSFLAEVEENSEIKEKLLEFSSMEKKHAEFWKNFLISRGIEVREFKLSFTMNIYKMLRRVFGIGFTSRIMEVGEAKTIRKYYEFYRNAELSEDERMNLRKIIEDELLHEDIFQEVGA